MAVSGEQFSKALVASTLMTADELQAFWKALPEADRPKDGTALSKQLVAAGKLTQFQADQILAGRGAGLVLGDYVLMSKIGAGGMGQVFKAQHRVMERVVAVKLLPPSMVKDEAAVKRFQREVKAAAKLSHPNIVAALDARNERGVWYLVMEYVEGSDLSSLIKTRGPLPLDEALNYVRQAAAGLAFAHGKGVVHRDIKPANLLLDGDGVVKILDMGLARFDEGTAADHQLTNTGQVMGTVDYMAPEQAFDTRHADAKADVYSLGCSLYRLLVGDNVFGGDTVVQKILAHREQPIPDLRDRCPQANDAMNTLFQRMMAKKPDDRPTMAEIVGLIDAARGVTGGVSGATSNFNASDSNLNQFLQGLGGGSSTATGSSAYKTVGEEGMTEVMGNQKLRRIMGPDLTQSFSKPEAGTDPKSQVSFQGGPNQEQDSGSSKSKVTSRDRQGAAPPWKKPAVLIGGGAAAFLLIALGVWVIIRDKGGKEIARVEAPDGASVEVKTSAPGAFDLNLADRAVVEWICANQGNANIEMIGDGKIRNVDSKSAGKLPAETFALVACRFPKKVKPPAEIIKLLVDCKRLNEVDMNGVGIVDSDLAPWSKLPQLKTLNLPYNDLTATALLALRNQRSLANLDIHNTKIEAKSAVGFAMAQPKLESLACNWDNAAIEAFVPPATLRKVILYDLSDTRAMRVGQWSKLETLVISSSGMLTEAGFKELCKLTNLRSLQFISGVPVEDGWLVHLANLPQLENLSLVQTKVTDAGIEQLARLKNLKSLSLTQTRVSSTGIVKLSQALPICRVEKDGNVRGPGGASSASGIASSNIPAEALEYGGHRYLLVNVKTLWDKARAEAEALGGHLVTINSPAERDWIGETFIGPKRAVPLEGDRILLGGFNDDPSQPWQWVTGEPFDESLGQKKWANDSSGGRKVLSTHGATSWDDVRPNSTYAYVIEWDTSGGPPPIDLIARFDAAASTPAGAWRKDDSVLTAANGTLRLSVPSPAPDEYDLDLDFERVGKTNQFGINLGFMDQGRQPTLVMDDTAEAKWCIVSVDKLGHNDAANPTRVAGVSRFEPGERHIVKLSVRRDGLRVVRNGTPIIDWQGKPEQLSTNNYFTANFTNSFFITSRSPFKFHRITLTPVGAQPVSTSPQPQAPNPSAIVYLDDLQESEWRNGYQTLGKHGHDNQGAPIVIGGDRLAHALFTHPASNSTAIVTYTLAGKYQSFVARVAMSYPEQSAFSGLSFRVVGDGRELWKSKTIQKPTDEDSFAVSVAGVKVLQLEVNCPGANARAHAVWIDPRLTPVAAPAAQPSPTQGEGAGVVSPIERLLSADYEWTAPESLGPVVNAAASTYAPTLSDDQLSLIVFSYGKSGDKKNGIVEFRRPTIDGPWSDAVQVTDTRDGYPALRANGLMLLTVGDSPKNADGKSNRDLFVRTRPTRDAPWGPPSKLPLLNTEHTEYRPVISPDGLSLVFSSNRPGGVGAMDLWISRRADLNAAWQPPVSLGDKVNTSKEEHASQILADNQTILVNRGDGALFAAAPDVQGNYALKAVPLPAGVKVNKCWLSPDGTTLYFDNYKPGGSSGEGANEIRLVRRVPKGSVASLPAVATASGAQPRTPNSTATGSAAATGTAAAAGSADRAAAEWVQSQQGTVDLIEPGKAKVTIKPGETLPTGPFQVQTIYFLGTARSIADDELAVLAGLKNLDGLYLGGLKGFTDAGLKHLAGLTSLTNFAIFYNDRIFDEGMKHLAALRKLETLEIAATRVTDKGLQVFLGCPLRKLSVGGRPAADNMLPVVVQFKQLDDLSLHGSVCTDANVQLLQELPALKRLNLLKTNLTNNGLKTIATLKVSDLYLEGDFTDAGLKHLESMPSLSRFSYRGGKFTASGLAALKKALPQCTITGDGEKK